MYSVADGLKKVAKYSPSFIKNLSKTKMNDFEKLLIYNNDSICNSLHPPMSNRHCKNNILYALPDEPSDGVSAVVDVIPRDDL